MKMLLGLVFFLTVIPLSRAYDARMLHVVEQLRDLKEVGSDAVGYAGAPHDFYLLYQYSWHAATNQDVIDMVRDESPVVRLMGAKCALTSPYRKIDPAILEPLYIDPARIVVGAGGCVFETSTVGAVTRAMKRDADFLGGRMPRFYRSVDDVKKTKP